MSEHPGEAVWRRVQAVAATLLSDHRAGDPAAMDAVLRHTIEDASGPEGERDPEGVAAGLRIVVLALVELADEALTDRPADADQWVSERLHRFRDPR